MKIKIQKNVWADSRAYSKGSIIDKPTDRVKSMVENKEMLDGKRVAVEIIEKEDKKENKSDVYPCEKCGSNHTYTSKIGKEHLKYKE
jgi:hypothetical protein